MVTTLGESVPDLEAVALSAGLARVGRQSTLREYVVELWHRRYFAFTLAWSRFSANNTQDRLGTLWNVLRPLLQAGVYAAIFGLLLRGSGGKPPHYVEFVTAGVFTFTFLSGSVTAGSKAIVGDLGLVRTLRFPRAVLPASAVLIQFYAFMPALGVLLVLLAAVGNLPSVDWLLLPPAVLIITLFGLGMAFLCARITSMVRDFTQLLPFLLRVLFYLSGVIVDIGRVSAKLDKYPVAQWLLTHNPFHVYLELVRQSLLRDRSPIASYWAYGVGWALLALVVGFLFFWRGEDDYGR